MSLFDPLLGILDGDATARWNYVGDPARGLSTAASVTYSFLAAVPSYDQALPHPNFAVFDAAMTAAARQALAAWAAVCNLTFTEVSDAGAGGLIRFGRQDMEAGGYAYLPHFNGTTPSALAGDIYIANWPANNRLAPGDYGYDVLVHEIGHAIGLKHPFEAALTLPGTTDTLAYTVMSYTEPANSTITTVTGTASQYHWTSGTLYPSGPMLYDIAAVQALYGANASHATGDDTYAWALNARFFQTIWDAGGSDLIDAGNQALACVIDLQDGHFSSIGLRLTEAEKRLEIPTFATSAPTPSYDGRNNLAIAFGAVIENARGGSGDDQLIGNVVANALEGGAGSDTIEGGAGEDRVLYRTSPAGVLLDLAAGIAWDALGGRDQLSGIEDATGSATGDDTLLGDGGDNRLAGEGGNDRLAGRGGDDWLEGGAGLDTLVLDLPRRLLAVTLGAGAAEAGLVAASGTPYAAMAMQGTASHAGETDRFDGMETLAFADGRLVFDPGDPLGQVARLFYAALGRAPDALGLNAWTALVGSGAPLASLARAFTESAEFQARYPAVDNAGFVTLLYENALGRAPDATGLAQWLGAMDAGMSPATLLTQFSESAENYGRTAGLWSNGLWDMDETGAAVARLYHAALGRAPDAAGWQNWTGMVQAGMPLHDMAAGFLASPEFQARYPAVEDTGYATLLYQNTLGRAPDAAGLSAWTSALAAGMDRATLLVQFSESLEHQQLTLGVIEGGIAFA